MEFIREGATLPVPLNIIPMPSLIVKLFKKIFGFVLKKDKFNRPTNEIEMPPRQVNGKRPTSQNNNHVVKNKN